ncbi:MAG: PilN domain-containing protein, partial [Methylobacteriaceae bacterium]|nr:PilN domain-containing protein [Methylobacteriaceae bacterium]
MTILQRIITPWSAFLDTVAGAVAVLVARHAAKRRVRLVETPGRDLAVYLEGAQNQSPLGRISLAKTDDPQSRGLDRLLRGSHATIQLDPRRFVFRTLELPRRATDFLAAIVRTQIDRLTPWQPEQAVFGWSEPSGDGDGDKVALSIAATDRSLIAPILQAVQDRGAGIVVARVAPPNGSGDASIVVAEISAAAFNVAFWRRQLARLSLAAALIVIAAVVHHSMAVHRLHRKYELLTAAIAEKRALLTQLSKTDDPGNSARRVLVQRKHDMPFVTLAIEALSGILPDDTYLTELQVEGAQLRLVGLTADAPTLVRLIEKSNLFMSATFFAPTTRLP